MIRRAYRLHRLQYGPQLLEAIFTMSTGLHLHGEDDIVSTGHIVEGSAIDTLIRYKFIEYVGNETHEHFMLAFSEPGSTDGENATIFRSRILSPDGVRVIQYTQPTIALLEQLTPRNNDMMLVPFQHEILRILKSLSKYYSCYNHELLVNIEHCIQHYHRAPFSMFSTLPESLSSVQEAYQSISDLFTDLYHTPNTINIKKAIDAYMYFGNIRYAGGISRDLVNGGSPELNLLHTPISPPLRPIGLDLAVAKYINPHLVSYDTVVRNSYSESVTNMCYSIIDVVDYIPFTDFSLTIYSSHPTQVTVNYLCDENTGDGIVVPYTTSIHALKFGVQHICVDVITQIIDECIGIYDRIRTTAIREVKITLCKSVNEILVIHYDTIVDGVEQRISVVIDLLITHLLTPAVMWSNKHSSAL